MTITDSIDRVVKQLNGSIEYKCALQVNPFSYNVKFQNSSSEAANENDYNEQLVDRLIENQIQVIGITDHFNINSAKTLIQLAESKGIIVFPGFEAVSKEGVHLLCLFETGTSIETLIGHIGWFDLSSTEQPSPISSRTAEEIFKQCLSWRGIVVAAHVCSNSGGLFEMLSGQAAIRIWQDNNLLAC